MYRNLMSSCGRILLIILTFSLVSIGTCLGKSGIIEVHLESTPLFPGTFTKVTLVPRLEGVNLVGAWFDGREIPLVRDGGGYWCLIGIGLGERPGKKILSMRWERNGERGVEVTSILVKKKEYPKEFLRVSKKMVEFSKKQLERVLADQKAIREAVMPVTKRPLFRGGFIKPVPGAVKSQFGLRRFFNNKPRSPHSGVDLKAPMDTPVLSCNSGRVVLVRDCYLSGKTVVIDHGLGLYSIYAHLDKVFVQEGQFLKKGERIGLSGMTGRATGPHLHWGVSLYGMRLDPLALLKVF